jgi:hypothetical protein
MRTTRAHLVNSLQGVSPQHGVGTVLLTHCATDPTTKADADQGSIGGEGHGPAAPGQANPQQQYRTRSRARQGRWVGLKVSGGGGERGEGAATARVRDNSLPHPKVVSIPAHGIHYDLL